MQHRLRSRLLSRQPAERLRQGPARVPGVARSPQHPRQADEADQLDVVGLGTQGNAQIEGLAEHQRLTLQALKQGLPEPFWLISGQFPEYLPMCREEGLHCERPCFCPTAPSKASLRIREPTCKSTPFAACSTATDAKSPTWPASWETCRRRCSSSPTCYFFTSVMLRFELPQAIGEGRAAGPGRPFVPRAQATAGRLLPGPEGARSGQDRSRWPIDSTTSSGKTSWAGWASSAANCFPIIASWPRVSDSAASIARGPERLAAGHYANNVQAECERRCCATTSTPTWPGTSRTAGTGSGAGSMAVGRPICDCPARSAERLRRENLGAEIRQWTPSSTESPAALSAKYDAGIVQEGLHDSVKRAVDAVKLPRDCATVRGALLIIEKTNTTFLGNP